MRIPSARAFTGTRANSCKHVWMHSRMAGRFCSGTPNIASYLSYQYTLLDMPPHHMSQWSGAGHIASLRRFCLFGCVAFFTSRSHHTMLRTTLTPRGGILASLVTGDGVFYSGIGRLAFEALLQRGLRRFFAGQSMLLYLNAFADFHA